MVVSQLMIILFITTMLHLRTIFYRIRLTDAHDEKVGRLRS
jgi:hypothetical protein